jgi:hypothetical protein
VFKTYPVIIVQQIKEMLEIIIDWETANKYEIKSEQGDFLGFAAERTLGIFHRIIRNILRSHRPMTIDVWDNQKKHIYIGKRPFYFFFSDLEISDNNNRYIGEIKTRFGLLKRKYDLIDAQNNVFAQVESYRWRLWTFQILGRMGNKVGVISKKWGGLLKEAFTDADRFAIDLSRKNWTQDQKAILLFATLCIDLDFFEDNSNSVLDFSRS